MRLEEWREATMPGALTAEGRELAQRLTREGRLRVDELRQGVRVQATSYVGRVRLGGLAVTVQPKLRGAPLQRLLRYAYGLRNLELHGEVDQGTAEDSMVELLVHQLVAEAEELLARGLHRTYVGRREDLASPRGRIDFVRYAAQGAAATLPCVHHPREEDCLPNQALLEGLREAAGLTEDAALRRRALRLAARLQEGVSRIRLGPKILAQALRGLDRRTEKYAPALRIVALLCEEQGLAVTEGAVRLPGFLFDMNRFFQHLLGRFLEEHVPTGVPGASVAQEHRLVGMLRYAAEHNPKRRQAPMPRPDFAVSRQGRPVVLLDAKYRDLWERSLPREMLYQLGMYAMSQGTLGSATILYPTLAAEAKEARIEIRDPMTSGLRGYVALRPVHLPTLDALLKEGREGSPKGCETFARRLALGED